MARVIELEKNPPQVHIELPTNDYEEVREVSLNSYVKVTILGKVTGKHEHSHEKDKYASIVVETVAVTVEKRDNEFMRLVEGDD